MPENTKPPIGVVPKYIWDERRRKQLKESITRYLDADLKVDEEWVKEYNQLIDK